MSFDVTPGDPAQGIPPLAARSEIEILHRGKRHILGKSPTEVILWSVNHPGTPLRRWSLTDDNLARGVAAFNQMELDTSAAGRYVAWADKTKAKQAERERAKTLTGAAHKDPDGNLRCPKCNGAQFKAVHSFGRKAMLGFGTLLFSANKVECVTCGTKFDRG